MELTTETSHRSRPRSRGPLRLEVRTPAGSRAYLVSASGLGAPLPRPHARPDVTLVGDDVALTAVLGGFIAPLAAAREGQLEVLGGREDLARLGELLASSLAA